MVQPEIAQSAPFFVVHDVRSALGFYRDQLAFEVSFAEPRDDPFFAIVNRGGAMVFLKAVGVEAVPNHRRATEARWDAYFGVPDPDALAVEFSSRHVRFSVALQDTDDGLRGFELEDPDGYVLFFGRPR